jgi:hypothetical protein
MKGARRKKLHWHSCEICGYGWEDERKPHPEETEHCDCCDWRKSGTQLRQQSQGVFEVLAWVWPTGKQQVMFTGTWLECREYLRKDPDPGLRFCI